AMGACAHHSNSACHRAPIVMIAISDSRRSIDVPNLSFAPSADSRRPAPGAVTNALNGPASPPSAVRTRSLRPLTMPSHSCCPSGSSSSRRTYGIRLIARTITSAPPAFTSRHPLPLPHPDALPRPLPVGRLSAPPPRPPSESRHPSPTRRPLLSHTILTRLFIRITYLISEYTGDHGQNALICSEKQPPSSPGREVVHARVPGPRGPRARRRPRLAGPGLRAGRGLPRGRGGPIRGVRAFHRRRARRDPSGGGR